VDRDIGSLSMFFPSGQNNFGAITVSLDAWWLILGWCLNSVLRPLK
jgi:hypothetical protein